MIVVWPIVVLVALLGWGVIVAWVARAVAQTDFFSAGELLSLGVALFLAVAGLAVAVDAYRARTVILLMFVGIACAIVELGLRVRRSGLSLSRRHASMLSVGAVLVGLCMLIAYWRTANFVWQVCDDDGAYLYLAKRLLVLGNLLDPLNNRRLTSLGGMSALQAPFLARLPENFFQFADASVGSLMILCGLWRTRLAKWSVCGIAAALAVILFPTNMQYGYNSTPTLIATGFAIAVVSAAMKMRVESHSMRAHLVGGTALGLLAGAAASLRPQLGLALVLVASAVVLWPPFSTSVGYRLAGLILGLTASMGGWAVASLRAVGTPFFPVFSGNLDPTWPANGPPASPPSVMAFLGRLAGTLTSPDWALPLLLGICLIVFFLRRRQEDRLYAFWAVRVSLGAAACAILLLAGLVDVWWGIKPPTYARLWAPLLMGSVLLPLVVINGSRAATARLRQVAGVVGLVFVGVATTTNPVKAGMDVFSAARDTINGSVAATLSADRYATVRSAYSQAIALVPAGDKVLAAVDYPSLLLRDGVELNTLDIAGSTSPSPHLPYFLGTAAKLSWFSTNGYKYIVAADPSGGACLYSSALQNANVKTGGVSGAWAPYLLDWFQFLQDLSSHTHTVVGPLVVYKL